MDKTSKWSDRRVNEDLGKLMNKIVTTTAQLQVIHSQRRILSALQLSKTVSLVNKDRAAARAKARSKKK